MLFHTKRQVEYTMRCSGLFWFFQEHYFDISRDIVYSVFTAFQLQLYDIIIDLICIIEKRQYL